MPVIVAETTRGPAVESVHHGVVVAADVSGEIVAAAGDPEHFAYFRSSAKPFQAVPLVESGAADAFGFTPAELAMSCASHNAESRHQAQVAAMLAKIGLGPEALGCGIAPPIDPKEAARVTLGEVESSPVQCECSGEHAGMLAVCRHLGYPIAGYVDADHPLQRRILTIVAEVLRMEERQVALAPDGCALPTFGAPLRSFATAYATFARPEQAPAGAGREHAAALTRLRDAMAAHPENISGEAELDTDLMALSEGKVIAKLGAEGLLCLAVPERGMGIAIRVLDGDHSDRARAVVALAALEQLRLVEPDVIQALRERHGGAIANFHGRAVGEVRARFRLAA